MLVNTKDGVQEATPLDRVILDAVGNWLCDKGYHEVHHWGGWSATQIKRFESEQVANGGYCDECRDFAGALITQFKITL